ncbi:Gag-Pol polyprotein-like protein [Argiope bruennichi]|uniref:Gag-Pol polyprotein-like protein n=1 Tax=Argiope bruennichi TaxID=94029 RepID=A0A8T0EIW1_ARGBR|nr:Gag-Pol polyprotein-like protein [Argiope bruennichi]
MAFWGKIRKTELVSLGQDLDLEVHDKLKVVTIMKMIMEMEDYDVDRTDFHVEIQCDQGTSFVNNLTSTFFESFGIKVCHSSVHHPQSNPAERFHRTIKRILRVVCIEAGTDWERHLPSALGFSPSELVFGKQLRPPEMLLYEKWTQAEIESSPVIGHVFNLINRLKRCQELSFGEDGGNAAKTKRNGMKKNAHQTRIRVGDLFYVLSTSRPTKLSIHG